MTLTWDTEETDSSYEVSITSTPAIATIAVGQYHIAGLSAGTFAVVNVTAISAYGSRTLLFNDKQITGRDSISIFRYP